MSNIQTIIDDANFWFNFCLNNTGGRSGLEDVVKFQIDGIDNDIRFKMTLLHPIDVLDPQGKNILGSLRVAVLCEFVVDGYFRLNAKFAPIFSVGALTRNPDEAYYEPPELKMYTSEKEVEHVFMLLRLLAK